MNLVISNNFLQSNNIKEVTSDHILNLIKLGNNVEQHMTKVYTKSIKSELEEIDESFAHEDTLLELKDIKTELLRLNMLFGGGTKKGKIAEKIILETLHRHFPDAEIDDTGYEFAKGDIIIKYHGYKLMIEIKNYDGRSINTVEQQKFIRDLSQNDYDGGILLSCRSGIAHKHNKFTYETANNKLAVYLSNAGSDGYTLIWAILFIISSLKMMKEFKISKDRAELLHACIKKKLSNIQQSIDYIESVGTTLFTLKTSLIKTLNNGIKNIEISLNDAKQNLTSTVEDIISIIETGKINTNIFLAEESKNIVCDIENMNVKELKNLCKKKNIKYSGKNKTELKNLLRISF